MTTEEELELARAMPRLIRRLRLRSSRRLRRARRGAVWMRRVHRESLAGGGVPFALPFRRPRRRRPRVVLLVDVSFSVARAAGFFLWLAAELVRLERQTRVLLFVDRPVEATAELRRWLRGGVPRHSPARRDRADAARPPRFPGAGIRPSGPSFAELLRSLPTLNLEAPSDYGRALHRLLRPGALPHGRRTLLIVLGDARTNRFDALPWALETIARRTRAVLWLVPEPYERWGTGDSALGEYLPFVDTVVEARDLEGLGRGVAELLRRM